MKEYMKKLQEKLSDIQYILLAAIMSIIIVIPMEPLVNLYEKYVGQVGDPILGEYKLFMFLSGTSIVPLIESFFIVFIIKILKNKFNINKKINLWLITTSIFSLMHYYSILYIIVIFIPCGIIIYSYLYYEPKKLSPFAIMLWVHIISNAISFIMQLL